MFGCFFDFHILLLPTNARFKVAAFKGKHPAMLLIEIVYCCSIVQMFYIV